MSKLILEAMVPQQYDKARWQDVIRAICNQVNSLSEGALAAKYNAQTTQPSVAAGLGDFIPDANTTITNGSVRLGWVCTTAGNPATFQEARVLVANFGQITNSLAANVSLNNVANYFDGPSIAQGTVGTWFVSGTVSLQDATAGNNSILAKLWDGTTVIDSGLCVAVGAGSSQLTLTLCGVISSPAGNLRISVRDQTTVNGLILANTSGNGKDSTITAIRIG